MKIIRVKCEDVKKEKQIFVAKFWRGNPQLKNGGYHTTRNIEAKNEKEAMKQVKKIENGGVYGSMTFEGWENN